MQDLALVSRIVTKGKGKIVGDLRIDIQEL